MIKDILITVIIPVYNVEKYLDRCADSVLKQTYGNLEIILVNDGSKDGSGALCEKLARKDSRIQVIHKENGGLSSARNAGIDIAKGEYLSFVDSDDWIEEDALEALLTLAVEENAPIACAGRYDVDSESGEKTIGLCPPKKETVSSEEFLSRLLHYDNCDSSACDKLFHKSLFREHRFPLGKRSEDVAVMYRIIHQAGRVAMLNRPLYNYFHRSGSISTTLSSNLFHSLEHTVDINLFVKETYPSIADCARYFRIKNMLYALVPVELDKQGKVQFAKERSCYHRELWSHLGFILRYSRFDRRDKLISIFLCLGIYGPAHRLLQKLKGK